MFRLSLYVRVADNWNCHYLNIRNNTVHIDVIDNYGTYCMS